MADSLPSVVGDASPALPAPSQPQQPASALAVALDGAAAGAVAGHGLEQPGGGSSSGGVGTSLAPGTPLSQPSRVGSADSGSSSRTAAAAEGRSSGSRQATGSPPGAPLAAVTSADGGDEGSGEGAAAKERPEILGMPNQPLALLKKLMGHIKVRCPPICHCLPTSTFDCAQPASLTNCYQIYSYSTEGRRRCIALNKYN